MMEIARLALFAAALALPATCAVADTATEAQEVARV